jgi:hypothetical protein
MHVLASFVSVMMRVLFTSKVSTIDMMVAEKTTRRRIMKLKEALAS